MIEIVISMKTLLLNVGNVLVKKRNVTTAANQQTMCVCYYIYQMLHAKWLEFTLHFIIVILFIKYIIEMCCVHGCIFTQYVWSNTLFRERTSLQSSRLVGRESDESYNNLWIAFFWILNRDTNLLSTSQKVKKQQTKEQKNNNNNNNNKTTTTKTKNNKNPNKQNNKFKKRCM